MALNNNWSLFVDLDGTILSDNYKEWKWNLQQYKLFCDNFDVNRFLATGRHPNNVLEFLGEIPLTHGGLITLNGGLVFINGEVILSKPYKLSIAQSIYTYLKNKNYSFFMLGRKKFVYAFQKSKIIGTDLLNTFTNVGIDVIKNPKSFHSFVKNEKNIFKFILLVDKKNQIFINDIKFFNSLSLQHGFSTSSIYEINPLEANKGLGVKAIVKHLGLNPTKLLAIGDGENDIELFKAVKYSVAMYNSSESLKKVATIVAEDKSFPWALKAMHLLISNKK